ncbi:MAG: response regulator [Sneathiella sp.]|nr:response regulator [Sneathiella sp.]
MTLEEASKEPKAPQNVDISTRAVLDVSPMAIVILDRETREIIYSNDKFLEILRINSFEELQTLPKASTWVDKDLFAHSRELVRQGQSVVNLEAERLRPDGSHWWSLTSIQNILFEGRQASILWQTDITENKIAEQKFAESQYQLQQIFEASPIAVGITRESDGTIMYANTSYATMFGYTPEEITGHEAVNLWANPDDRAVFKEKYERQGEIIQEEALGKCKNGDTVWVSLSWKPFQFRGQACHIFWFTNINKQKETEFALAAAKEKAEVAMQAKADFLATMSHEIRTPLNGVLGLAALLQKSGLDKDQIRKVDAIISSGQSLMTILNDVLDMSRIDSGGIELEAKGFRFGNLIEDVTLPFVEEAKSKELDFVIQCDFDEELIVQSDATRIRQIIWNLLGNAVKFTQQGGITISVTQTPNPAIQEQTQISIRVKDTGCGIPEDRLDSIFDAFTQADNTISRKFGGSGLELTIVNRLVQLFGGDIAVQSNQGGSVFEVVLPVRTLRELETVPEDQKIVTSCGRKAHVLVAEDNMVNAMIVRAILEDAGHEVRHALNGVEAVDQAFEDWADIILMDIRMPQMDGLEATRIIRETEKGKEIPIIAVTAEAFEDQHKIITETGIQDIITKPFNPPQILETIEKYCI